MNNKLKPFTIHYSQLGSACAARLTRLGRPQRFALSPFTKNGFTFAEAMIAILVLSLVVTASLPIMMKQAKTKATGTGGGGSLWTELTDGTHNIYYGNAASPVVVIGAKTRRTGDTARLQIRTSTTSQNHIELNQNEVSCGKLLLNNTNQVGLGTATISGSGNTYGVMLGKSITNSNVGSCSGTAVGYNAQITGATSSYENASVAFGYKSIATMSSVAIGSESYANGTANVCIGNKAQTFNTGSNMATQNIGYNAKPYTNSTMASLCIGVGTTAAEQSIAIGSYATTPVSAKSLSNFAIGGYNNQGAVIPGSNDNMIMFGIANNSVCIPGFLNVSRTTGATGTGAFVVNGSNQWSTSDSRLKDIHGEFTGGLKEIKSLKVYSYTFKKAKERTPQVGIMAQDLKKIFPNAVSKDNEGFLMVRDDDIFYSMINAVKQLDKIIQKLIAQIKEIEDKILNTTKICQANVQTTKTIEADNRQIEAKLAKLEKSVGK